jgi:hypothetical protein
MRLGIFFFLAEVPDSWRLAGARAAVRLGAVPRPAKKPTAKQAAPTNGVLNFCKKPLMPTLAAVSAMIFFI